MIYRPNSLQGYMSAMFEGKEVEAVRRAFDENNEYLKQIDQKNSVSPQQETIASWKGNRQTYTSRTNERLVDPLGHFIDVTEDKVDEILDTFDSLTPATRIHAASSRYRCAYVARVILETIKKSELNGVIAKVNKSRYK